MKTELAEMKLRVRTEGVYADPTEFRRKQMVVREHGLLHQRLQVALAETNRKLRQVKGRVENPVDADGEKSFHRHFVTVAKAILPRETFAVLTEAAEAAAQHQEQGASQRLIGQAPASSAEQWVRVK